MNKVIEWVLVFVGFVVFGLLFDIVHTYGYKWCKGNCNRCKNWQCKYYFDTRE